ncbi:MAG: CvpA family protein [Patescibacteria group bacterium]|jgi:uncharacterized membrane protein required for colicin V production
MSTTDIVLLVLLFGFTWAGFWYGIIQTLGGIVGVIAGAVIAGRFAPTAGSWISGLGNTQFTQWAAFAMIFVVVNRAVAIATGVIGKALNVTKLVPGVAAANRLGGALVGLVEGALTLGLLIALAERLQVSQPLLRLFDNSVIANILSSIGSSLMPLLPEAIKGAQSVLQL